MDFGAAMFFTDYSMSPADLGRALEARDFESVWAPEHSHIPSSRATPFPQGGKLPRKYYGAMDPFVTLTAAAMATKTLRIGTGVCLVAQRDVIQTAKLVASIDLISGGRFLFGVGGGWNAEEMADHGTAFKTRFKLMRERIEAMKTIWTEDEPEYHGELVQFPKIEKLAEAGAEAAAAGYRRRRFSACGATGAPLRERLDSACRPAAIFGCNRFLTKVQRDGGRSGPPSQRGPGHSFWRPRRSRPA